MVGVGLGVIGCEQARAVPKRCCAQIANVRSGSSAPRPASGATVTEMWRDVRLLMECVVASRRVRSQLASIGDLRELVGRLDGTAGVGAADDGASAERLVRAADRSVRLLGPRKDACVPRSLTLLVLWSSRRRAADFVSGVARHGGDLVGHAWLEAPDLEPGLGGRADDPEAYAEIFRYSNRWAPARLDGE